MPVTSEDNDTDELMLVAALIVIEEASIWNGPSKPKEVVLSIAVQSLASVVRNRGVTYNSVRPERSRYRTSVRNQLVRQ